MARELAGERHLVPGAHNGVSRRSSPRSAMPPYLCDRSSICACATPPACARLHQPPPRPHRGVRPESGTRRALTEIENLHPPRAAPPCETRAGLPRPLAPACRRTPACPGRPPGLVFWERRASSSATTRPRHPAMTTELMDSWHPLSSRTRGAVTCPRTTQEPSAPTASPSQHQPHLGEVERLITEAGPIRSKRCARRHRAVRLLLGGPELGRDTGAGRDCFERSWPAPLPWCLAST